MAIFIKHAATEKKIRELAACTGETIADAVDRAVDERLVRLCASKASGRVDWARLDALIAKVKAASARNQGMADDEVVGYDEHGVPC